MKNFTNAAVDYNGKEVSGIILPLSIQRINSSFEIPEGYTCIGKQQFGKGLRICFIPSELIQKPITKEMKNGEFSVSGYKTNLDIESDIKRLIAVTKECYQKDNSENHKQWLVKRAQYNMGLNNFKEIAEKTVIENWK
jgi:hypothetical protein